MKKTKRCITKKELRKIIAVTNAKDVVIFIDFHNSVCVCKELKEEQFIFENIQFVYVNDINPKFHTLFLFFFVFDRIPLLLQLLLSSFFLVIRLFFA